MTEDDVQKLLTVMGNKTWTVDLHTGKTIYSRPYPNEKQIKGIVAETTPCQDSGCSGVCLHILWDDGKQTSTCSTRCAWLDGKTLEIV